MNIGSADLMERNLDRRVETLAPVLDPGLAAALRDTLLEVYLTDTARTYTLGPDGSYTRLPSGDRPRFDAQLAWTSGALSLMHT